MREKSPTRSSSHLKSSNTYVRVVSVIKKKTKLGYSTKSKDKGFNIPELSLGDPKIPSIQKQKTSCCTFSLKDVTATTANKHVESVLAPTSVTISSTEK